MTFKRTIPMESPYRRPVGTGGHGSGNTPPSRLPGPWTWEGRPRPPVRRLGTWRPRNAIFAGLRTLGPKRVKLFVDARSHGATRHPRAVSGTRPERAQVLHQSTVENPGRVHLSLMDACSLNQPSRPGPGQSPREGGRGTRTDISCSSVEPLPAVPAAQRGRPWWHIATYASGARYMPSVTSSTDSVQVPSLSPRAPAAT